jgi:hypothetical protein
MTDVDFKYLMGKDKGCGMSYTSLYVADRLRKELERYNDRFFWNEGDTSLSRTKMPATQEEIDHANEVIEKVKKKFFKSPTMYK